MNRLDDLVRFYAILDVLAERQDGGRRLADCHGRMEWPRRGVYFFFEPGERRSESGDGPRVVRVGTHGIARSSGTTLWNRLAQHRGPKHGRGNHRGSIFRLLMGEAIIARDGLAVPSWGVAGSPGAAARRLDRTRQALLDDETLVEKRVSAALGDMRLLVLRIDDAPGPASRRAYIERNAIALLSNFGRSPLDTASASWLGRWSPRDKVRKCGLWNQDHVEATHETGFLDVLARLVGTDGPARRRPGVRRSCPARTPASALTASDLFSGVTLEHVRAAAARIDREGVPPRRAARSTVALLDGREYPAKYLLGLASEEATGRPLDSERYTGGKATAAVLANLGVDVRHGESLVRGHAAEQSAAARRRPRASSSARELPGAPSLAVATVAVRGTVSRSRAENRRRERLLPRIVGHIERHARPVDALVLPGGFFFLQRHVGRSSYAERVGAIMRASFAPAMLAAAKTLDGLRRGSLLVVGIDSAGRQGEGGDQLCVAFNADGVVGLARKVFPTKNERASLILSADDFGHPGRLVTLPSGTKALLCACYDAFGISAPERRASTVWRLRVDGRVMVRGDAAFAQILSGCIRRQEEVQESAGAALVAIHGFRAGGNCTMWQRHGIATASAALGGGLVAAGAHFESLPRRADAQTLCSVHVPREHLEAGHGRGAWGREPATAVREDAFLLRWFH